jgi:hypothetical protein
MNDINWGRVIVGPSDVRDGVVFGSRLPVKF